MPGVPHELLVSLFYDRPSLAAELLASRGLLELPEHASITRESANLSQVVPPHYLADELCVLKVNGQAIAVLIIEVQMERDAQKKFSWPCYSTIARARHQCPAFVLVVTLSPSVARWARRPIDLGSGNTFSPVVFGPTDIPLITNPEIAREHPELTVLSVVAHARSEHVLPTLRCAVEAFAQLDLDKQRLYNDFILLKLPQALRKAFLKMIDINKHEWQSDWAKGHILEGMKTTLKMQMKLKFHGLSERHTSAIDRASREVIDEALKRVLTAKSPEEVLDL